MMKNKEKKRKKKKGWGNSRQGKGMRELGGVEKLRKSFFGRRQ